MKMMERARTKTHSPIMHRADDTRQMVRSRHRHLARLFLVLLVVLQSVIAGAGCDSRQKYMAGEPRESIGSLTVALPGGTRWESGISRVDCTVEILEDQRVLLVDARSNRSLTSREGHPYLPSAVIARLPEDILDEPVSLSHDSQPVYGATAWMFSKTYRGAEYTAVEFIARRSVGGPEDIRCEASLEDKTVRLACDGALMTPWRNAGSVPTANFQLTAPCDPL